MPIAPIHIPPPESYSKQVYKNPLPPLIRLPSGLALLELQGTLNYPEQQHHQHDSSGAIEQYPIGTIIFPDAAEQKVKMAYWYIGKTQRMTGEVKPLMKPLAVLRKRRKGKEGGEAEGDGGDVTMGGTTTIGDGGGDGEQEGEEELEVVDVVRFKIIFSSRPEPVT